MLNIDAVNKLTVLHTTICFDFGNTRLKYGLFQDGELLQNGTLDNGNSDEINQLLTQFQPQYTLLSSVIKHDASIEKLLSEKSQFLLLDASVKLPFTVPVGKPETVGADRLAIAAYATLFFPKQNNLVIALGSCITYNFINKYHWFLGGSISPGMQMRFKSMHDLTAQLPMVQPNWEFPLVGYDTRTNLLSGVMQGMVEEIDGIIKKYEEKFLNFNVLLTGGDTGNFAQHIKYKIFADPSLILKGLYAISKYNHEINN